MWSAVVSTTGGVNTAGLTVTPDVGDPFAVTVETDDTVVGDVILFVSYPTTDDQVIFGVPILVTRRDPPGVALAGIEVLPQKTEVAPGGTVWPEFRAVYSDGSKQIRWAATDEVAVVSSDAAVVDAPDLARWEAISAGCATVSVAYAGFTTQSIITVTNPFPPRTFADWRDQQFTDEELTNSAIGGIDVDLDGDGLGTRATGYGDLQNVAYAGNGIFEMRIFADPGCEVVLEGFDMAARTSRFASDPTIDRVAVLDADGTVLYSRENVNGPTNGTYSYGGSGTPQKLTTSGLGGYGNKWPCVSPDGTRVAWVMVHTSPTVPTNLGVKRLDGSGIGGTFLADWDANDSHPCWSPDGTHIVFQRYDDESTGGLMPGESPNWNIYVVEAYFHTL